MRQLPSRCQTSLTPAAPPAPPVPVPSQKPQPIWQLRTSQHLLYVNLIQDSTQVESTGDVPAQAWVRPLLLVNAEGAWEMTLTADLLWPAAAFTLAYAEDLLPQLAIARPHPRARALLQQVMQLAWAEASLA